MQNLLIYLNDHLAGSVAAIELLDHLTKGSHDSSLKHLLTHVRKEIEEDQSVLRDFLKQLGAEESTMRKAAAWILEKITRLKFKSETDDEGLGVFEALEGLSLGILGKRALWRSLAAASLPQAHHLDYERLEKRAIEQFEQIQAKCLELAPTALKGGPD